MLTLEVVVSSLGVPLIGVVIWLSRLGARVDQHDEILRDVRGDIKAIHAKQDKILEKIAPLSFCPLANPECPNTNKQL
jgi:uncharacterized protein YoxC